MNMFVVVVFLCAGPDAPLDTCRAVIPDSIPDEKIFNVLEDRDACVGIAEDMQVNMGATFRGSPIFPRIHCYKLGSSPTIG